MRQLHITAAEAVTPIGFKAATTAAAVRAGISRLRRDELYLDAQGHPLSVCSLPDVEGFLDPIDRMLPAALAGLRRLLAGLADDTKAKPWRKAQGPGARSTRPSCASIGMHYAPGMTANISTALAAVPNKPLKPSKARRARLQRASTGCA